MKQIKIIVFIVICMCSRSFAQTVSNYRIVPSQAGTVNITSSKVTVNLGDNLKNVLHNQKQIASYYVVFTATSDSELPFVSDKNSESFTINYKHKANSNLPSSVDYVIFLKIEQKSSGKPETFIQPDFNKAP